MDTETLSSQEMSLLDQQEQQQIMDSVCTVIKKYQEILNEKVAFKFSQNRPTFGKEGVGNLMFYMSYMFQDRSIFFEFLRELGLLKGNMVCERCGHWMSITSRKASSDGVNWVCRKRNKIDGRKCGKMTSLRSGSWFACSRLKLEEIMMISFFILKERKTMDIADDLGLSSHTLAYWRTFIYEIILHHVEKSSEKIGGKDKGVEINESLFGRRKYIKGVAEDGQWVLGGVERGSGRLFLVNIPDQSPETLSKTIEQWIEEKTTVICESWRASDRLGSTEYDHLTAIHHLKFEDPVKSTQSNPEEEPTERHYMRSSLPSCKGIRKGLKFPFYMVYNMFKKSCQEQNVDIYNTFIEIIREIKWEEYNVVIS